MKKLDKKQVVAGVGALALAVGGAFLLNSAPVDARTNVKLSSDATVVGQKTTKKPIPKPTGEFGLYSSRLGF